MSLIGGKSGRTGSTLEEEADNTRYMLDGKKTQDFIPKHDFIWSRSAPVRHQNINRTFQYKPP